MHWQDWEDFRDGQWVPAMRIVLKVGLVIGICVALFLQFQGGKEGSTDSNQPSGTNATTATNQPATNAKAP